MIISAIDWFANNPYCIAIMCILVVVCCVVFVLDMWRKNRSGKENTDADSD